MTTLSSRKHPIVAAAALALAMASTAAGAQHRGDDGEYRRIARIQADRPEEALTRYQALYEHTRSPRALAQIAGVEAQMGRWVVAQSHISDALATNDRWIERNRSALEEMQRTILGHVCNLMVVANVPGATISVDGEARGTLPLSEPVRVTAGQVRVDLSAPGFESLRQVVNATPGRARVELAMLRAVIPTVTPPAVVPPPAAEPVAVPVTPVAPAAPAPTTAAPAAPATAPVVVVDGNPGATVRALGIASLALGVAGLGVGGVGVALFNSSVDAFNRGCTVMNGVVTGGPTCQSNYDEGNTMRALSTAGFITGGVLTAAGIAMILAAPRARPSGDRAGVVCGGAIGSAFIGCSGVF